MWMSVSRQTGASKTVLFSRQNRRVTREISKPEMQYVYEALWICMFNDKEVKNSFLIFFYM